ncbi:hypothetical protein V2J09_012586 [Rumex salicifolius]
MAAEASGSSSSADSYLGSLISLTSKSEIRYEGVLFTINTEEANIGLRNVRSFGTEGRRKDGQQIPPIDKVYEYIVFRGSDIKDLQVKSSPPPPPAAQPSSIHNDPAIIQSHYGQAAASANKPSVTDTAGSDHSTQMSQGAVPRPPFQSNLPLYQPGGTMPTWGSSAPLTTNANGPTPPIQWQGYYGASSNVQNQPSFLQPPQGIYPPPAQQPVRNSVLNAPVHTGLSVSQPSDFQPMLLRPPGGGGFDAQTMLPGQPFPVTSNTSSNMLPGQPFPVASNTSSNMLPGQPFPVASNTSSNVLPVVQSHSLPLVSPLSKSLEKDAVNSMASQAKFVSGPMTSYNGMAEPLSADAGSSIPPSLVTPGQFLQSEPAQVSRSQPLQTIQKDVEVVQFSSAESLSPSAVSSSVPTSNESQPEAPLLPLPSHSNPQYNRGSSYNRYMHRGGHGRGRRSELSSSATSYTEDFDFEAMNEKFKKDEVWGHLGKSKANDDSNEDSQYSDNVEFPQVEIQPVYKKDDFFDTLTSNSFDNGSRNGRNRFSEQTRFDNEQQGNFSRYRGGQGGRGPGYGGYQRGGYYGRGGYGYNAGRSQGHHNLLCNGRFVIWALDSKKLSADVSSFH